MSELKENNSAHNVERQSNLLASFFPDYNDKFDFFAYFFPDDVEDKIDPTYFFLQKNTFYDVENGEEKRLQYMIERQSIPPKSDYKVKNTIYYIKKSI